MVFEDDHWCGTFRPAVDGCACNCECHVVQCVPFECSGCLGPARASSKYCHRPCSREVSEGVEAFLFCNLYPFQECVCKPFRRGPRPGSIPAKLFRVERDATQCAPAHAAIHSPTAESSAFTAFCIHPRIHGSGAGPPQVQLSAAKRERGNRGRQHATRRAAELAIV